jgi:hypothetical protein
MPAKSEKQKKFMDAVAHNKQFAKQSGVPQSVGKEFSEASKGMKFGSGGEKTRAESQAINQPKTNHGDMALFKKGGSMASKMNPGFMAMMSKKKDAKPSAMGKPTMKPGMSTAKDGMKKPTPMADMMGMKKGGMKKMAAGGSTVPVKMLPYMGPKKEAEPKPIHPAGLRSGTSTTPKAKSMDEYKRGGGVKKMAAGGLSSGHKSANGVATKGKTKGTQITMSGNKGMKSGGMAKKYC